MEWEKRYEGFKKEYEKLCKKYEMYHDTYDKWETGIEEICVYDEKEKKYILD